jgi:2-keto-4-pentenoate hydratase/2-oxohepta-3-ene-1,7-dioic acid hydratase in catechol pathway
MNDKQMKINGYTFSIELTKRDLENFRKQFGEFQGQAQDNFMEMMGYADAKEVIANIKAKL